MSSDGDGGWADGSDAFSDGGASDGDFGVFGAVHAQPADSAPAAGELLECVVRSRAELLRAQADAVAETAGLLGLPTAHAQALLAAHSWDKEKLVDDFLADDEKLLRAAGLLPEGPPVEEEPVAGGDVGGGANAAPVAVATDVDESSSTPATKRKRPAKKAAPKKKATRKSSRRGKAAAPEPEDERDLEDIGTEATEETTPETNSPAEPVHVHGAPATPPTSAATPACITPSPALFECHVCYAASGPNEPSVRLACGHRFCVDCYRSFVKSIVTEDGQLGKLRCMEVGCKVAVDADVVRALVDDDVWERYQSLVFDSFIFSNPHLRYCPSPQCGNILSVATLPPAHLIRLVVPPTAACACGTELCFGCGEEGGHSPAICALWKLWTKKKAEETATGNWLIVNTKECIKCSSPIEKNGGCNHMTCSKCGFHWCWSCHGDWNKIGGYQHRCNAYVDAKSASAISDARKELKRYMHYFDRFENHRQSAKLGDEFMKRVEVKMLEMQGVVVRDEDAEDDAAPPPPPADPEATTPTGAHFSWISAQFLSTAAVTALACRRTLQNTYVHAYYLARESKGQLTTLELFEGIQADLEQAVERLSGLLERTEWLQISQGEAEKKRMEVQDLKKYCETRRRVVLDDIAAGLEEGRCEWSVKI
ncbi:hypothetical protein DFJ74DRAFT_459777 [Hyaloraphidium curvatum]|nr:hypothetical protein DFJ74DRAFT_459777 [Hyaloraphidium curvatum]